MSVRKFASLGALALFVRSTSIPAIELTTREILYTAGRRISERAKHKIGVPQPGWPPLAESTIERKARAGAARPEAPLLLTGALKESIGFVVHEGENRVEVGSNHKAAAVHELGSAHTPPRPFLQPSALEELAVLQAEIPILLEAAITGEVRRNG